MTNKVQRSPVNVTIVNTEAEEGIYVGMLLKMILEKQGEIRANLIT